MAQLDLPDALLAALALKLGMVTDSQLVKAAGDDQASLASELQRLNILSDKQREVLRGMLDGILAAHGGDADKALETLGGADKVLSTLPFPLAGRYQEGDKLGSSLTTEHPGRYTLKEEQGRGGQSTVLRALDEHIGRNVAFKELLAEGISGNARFLREARITAQLEHPNIIPVYEIGQRSGGKLYYTMKLVHGETLRAAIERRKTWEERRELLGHFEDLCNAIAYAHENGVIHRDIKPENVMVDSRFKETVVLDWGLAKKLGETEDPMAGAASMASANQTMDGEILGTPSYMSPEQARGDLAKIDAQSDVFALGAVLFEICTGRPPFVGPNAIDVVVHAMSDRVPLVRSICADVPPDLAAIADKALQREKEDRYANAEAMAHDVANWRMRRFVSAYGYGGMERLTHFLLNTQYGGRVILVAAMVLVVTIGLLLGSADLYWKSQAKAEQIAARQAEETANKMAQSLLGTLADQVAELPGGSKVMRQLVDIAAPYYEGSSGPTSVDDEAQALLHLGRLAWRCGQMTTGRRLLLEAAGLEQSVPSTPQGVQVQRAAQEGMAQLDRLLGHPAAAQRALERLLPALPGVDSMRWRVETDLMSVAAATGQVELEQRHAEAALAQAEALQHQANTPEHQWDVALSQRQLGRLEREQGHLQAATRWLSASERTYREVWKAYPEDADAMEELAWAEVDLGRVSDAVLVLEQAARLHPFRWDVQLALAEAEHVLGHAARCQELCDLALRLAASDPQGAYPALVYSAVTAAERGDRKTAAEQAQQAATVLAGMQALPDWQFEEKPGGEPLLAHLNQAALHGPAGVAEARALLTAAY
ncbi:MAG: protein kinase domain-containing protein [Candidatus Xenobia bacterium]